MEVCLGTGQRIGDVLKMRSSDIEEGGISVNQSKTSKHLWISIVSALLEAMDATPKLAVFILTNHRATDCWSYRGASQAVRNIRKEIEALDYDIHSWRYDAACELVEAGCSDDLVSAVTGQSPQMVVHYTRQKRQRAHAIEAQRRRKTLR